jgi:hypothetical protein
MEEDPKLFDLIEKAMYTEPRDSLLQTERVDLLNLQTEIQMNELYRNFKDENLEFANAIIRRSWNASNETR